MGIGWGRPRTKYDWLAKQKLSFPEKFIVLYRHSRLKPLNKETGQREEWGVAPSGGPSGNSSGGPSKGPSLFTGPGGSDRVPRLVFNSRFNGAPSTVPRLWRHSAGFSSSFRAVPRISLKSTARQTRDSFSNFFKRSLK